MASRAATLACKLAFEELAVRRVEILRDPDNIASRRVAIRIGSQEAGTREGRVLHLLEAAERANRSSST